MAEPLAGEYADGGRPAADPHALLGLAVDHRRLAGLDGEFRAAVDLEIQRLLVAKGEHRLAGDHTLLLAAAGQMADAAECEHLRAVFGRGDMAHLLALGAHGRLLRADEAVGIDFQLQAAIAEDALGDDGDHVDVAMAAGDDEGRRLVVGIGSAGTNAGDDRFAGRQQRAAPFASAQERHHGAVLFRRARDDDHGIGAGEHPIDIAIAIAGPGSPGTDAAKHRAGIAGDDAVLAVLVQNFAHFTLLPCARAPPAPGRAWPGRASGERRWRGEWRRGSRVRWESGPARRYPWHHRARAVRGPQR